MADEAAPARPAEGENPDLRAAAARIMALSGGTEGLLRQGDFQGQGNAPAARDPVANTNSSELAASEAEEADAARKAGETKADKTAAAETEGATEGADLEFIEIPGAEEGTEAERVPLAEAVEAIKQARTLKDGVAAAINQAEVVYQAEQDAIIGEMVQMHQTVLDRAEAALRMIPRPQRPDRSMLDSNSQNYNPDGYRYLELQYEDQVRLLQGVAKQAEDSKRARDAAEAAQKQIADSREHDRLARLWPEWKDPVKREAKQKALSEGLQKHYGIPPDMLDKYPFDHRIMRMVSDIIEAKEKPARAAEVKKAVQASAPKIVKGQATPDRTPDGRFQVGAMKRLSETGSREDAAAAIKGLGLANIIRR